MSERDVLPTIAVSFDIDGSLIDWQEWGRGKNETVFQSTLEMLLANQHQLAIFFNTGRSLLSIQKIKAHLAPIPMVGMMLCNGQELYIKLEGKPFTDWVLPLTQAHQEPGWKSLLNQQTGWCLNAVWQGFDVVLTQSGFQLSNTLLDVPSYMTVYQSDAVISDETILAIGEPDQSSLIFRTVSGHFNEGHQDKIAQLEAGIATWLAKQNIQFATRTYTFQKQRQNQTPIHCLHVWFEPEGVSKGAALDYWLNQQTHINAVITVGDHHYNDCEMLARPHYFNRDQKAVPNFPIVVADDPIVNQHVTETVLAERIAYAAPGDLSDALEQQIAAINLLLAQPIHQT